MRITDVIQRTPQWERWRAKGVTASEAAIILGRSPYKTPWRLWAERTGLARAADLSANPHVQRGNALEDAARRAFEERHDTMLLPLCGESDEHPVLRASFDGIADDGSPVELKVPAERTFAEVSAKTTEAPAFQLYWPQIQHQLCVAGAVRGWLVFYGGPQRLLEFPVERDEAFLNAELVPACLAFWEAVAKRKEPPRDPARDLYVPVDEELDHWSMLAGEYRDLLREKAGLDARLKESKEDLDRVEAALIGMMGGFLAAKAAGVKVTRYLQSGAIDYGKALKALLPELDAAALETYRRRASERVRITPLAGARPPYKLAPATLAAPDDLRAPDLPPQTYDRLSVAYGLSYIPDDIGRIFRMEETRDFTEEEARQQQGQTGSYRESFIDKDMM